MTRMVSQILWEHCMGELGIDGNNYENNTFAVHSYDWVDEDNNEWHFWHKPSGLKVQWYKYPLRGLEANMEISDDQFLDVLRDCTNSMEDGKAVRFLHDIRRWWADRKTEPSNSEIPNNCEHITEDGVTCAKYPACDDCLDNPLNKVKGSERLLKGKDESQMGDAKPIPLSNRVTHIKDEPQTDVYDYKGNGKWERSE